MGASPGADAAAEKDVFDSAGAAALVRGGRAPTINCPCKPFLFPNRASTVSTVPVILAETDNVREDGVIVATRSESLSIDAAPPLKAYTTLLHC